MKIKKYYNVFFPIWLIILFPPIIFITLIINFIFDSLIIIFTLKYLKISNYKDYLKKSILKTWILGFTADIIGVFILIFGMSFLVNIFPNAINILEGVYANPFSNIISFLIVCFVIFIVSYFIYLFNYYFVFNKIDLTKKNKKTLSLSLSIFTSPYLFLILTIY